MVASVQPDDFRAIVEYNAPLFWAFLNLVALSVRILGHLLRRSVEPAFRAPLFPLLLLLFGASCVYLSFSSLG
jgi:basic amino acid/polyamine antiporter, APA family